MGSGWCCSQELSHGQHEGQRSQLGDPPSSWLLLVKQQGGNTARPINRKLDYRFTEHGPVHQKKTQCPPQSVSSIRKLPQASYPSPSEGRQTENHNHRKLTNLITWTTALSNSVKLGAMPCRAIQDGRVTVGTSDRRDTLEKGMASHFNSLALRTQWKAWKGKKIWHWKMNSPG